MKRILFALALVLSLVFVLSGCGQDTSAPSDAPESGSQEARPQDDKLTVVMELAYPPFEMKDEAGEPSGISADFIRAFGEHVGREVEIVNTAWDGLIPSLQTGKADIIISSMTITEEREQTVDFSNPYANSLLAVLVNKDSGIETIDDLNVEGKKVAVKTGSTGHMYAMQNLTEAEVIVLADESACVTEVSQGKADGFIYDQLTIYRNQQANPDTTSAVFIPFQEADYWGIAVQEGNTELLSQINEFIETYTQEGGFDELSQKYLAEEKETFQTLGFKWFFDLSE